MTESCKEKLDLRQAFRLALKKEHINVKYLTIWHEHSCPENGKQTLPKLIFRAWKHKNVRPKPDGSEAKAKLKQFNKVYELEKRRGKRKLNAEKRENLRRAVKWGGYRRNLVNQ